MTDILLSICIPTFNRPNLLYGLVKDIISFQSGEIEIVISDDYPNSNKTKKLVDELQDSRIKYYQNKKNLGYDANVIMCVKRSNGRFFFFICDDDDIEMNSIPWVLGIIKNNNNISQICGTIGEHSKDSDTNYMEFGERLVKKGYDSLKELLFYYSHGCGIVIRKDSINIELLKNYIGFLYMQQALIAQALITGDTICISKTFGYVGKNNTMELSNQPLFRNTSYTHPLNRLNQMKFRIKIIYDITRGLKSKRNTRTMLLNKMRPKVISYLYRLTVMSSIIGTINGLTYLPFFKRLAFSPRFWINLVLDFIIRFLGLNNLKTWIKRNFSE